MAKIIIGIGLPGSGKTTVLKPLAEKYSYTYVSPDVIREEIAQSAFDQTKNREVWEEAHRRVAHALETGETVVFDATFIKDFERKNFIKFARKHGAEKVQGIFMAVPLEVADERNNDRERVIPRYAMDRMHNQLSGNAPVVEDGFDSVFDLNEYQELMRVEMDNEHNVLEREFRSKTR